MNSTATVAMNSIATVRGEQYRYSSDEQYDATVLFFFLNWHTNWFETRVCDSKHKRKEGYNLVVVD